MKHCFKNPLPKSGDTIRILATTTKAGAKAGEDLIVTDAWIPNPDWQPDFMIVRALRIGAKSVSILRSTNYLFKILD